MEPTTSSTTISNEPLAQPGMDFEWLRKEGIKRLQRLSGKIWTDHNLHDPGITILEQLCYALTDLSYRIDYDIRDLLTDPEGNTFKSLYSPAQILTTNPVTLADIRKIVIDIPGVKNAWVEMVDQPDPVIYLNQEDKSLRLTNDGKDLVPLTLKGLYKVFIQKEESEGSDIQPLIRERLMASRNVCEDYAEIRILESQPVEIAGEVELGTVENINAFVAGLFFQLSQFVSPRIQFYTLEEMLNKGLQIDEIVDGPVLEYGFIDNDELLRYDRKYELHTSDIIRELMDAEGVIAVNNIVLVSGGTREDWRLVLDDQKTPKLDWKNSLNQLRFTKNGLQINPDARQVEILFNELVSIDEQTKPDRKDRDIVPTEGIYRSPGTYHSIQHQFPLVYATGEYGLPESASEERKAQVRQLKAYLSFFDQLLANYFAQTEHIRELFSFHSEEIQTYFYQSLSGIVPGSDDFLNSADGGGYENLLQEYSSADTVNTERKNRFLNHLLARFSESFTDYSLVLYDYSNRGNNLEPMERTIQDKLHFLRNYPSLSSDRLKGTDYTTGFTDTTGRSGLEKRIAAKLGIPEPDGALLSEQENREGFYLLEHLLLRPVREDYNAYLDFLVSRQVTTLENADNGYVRCVSPGHGLQNGEQITINGTGDVLEPQYDASYIVEQVLPDTFLIKTNFIQEVSDQLAAGKLSPTWIRTVVDTTFLLLTRPVESFEPENEEESHTRCKVTSHGLTDDELIEINGVPSYNGKYAVRVVDADHFIIDKTYTENTAGGRWISSYQKRDPYSLQLTIVFPDWPDRFRSNDHVANNFRAFAERVIREETPVHLTVYVRWLNKEEMAVFEAAFRQFNQQLSNN